MFCAPYFVAAFIKESNTMTPPHVVRNRASLAERPTCAWFLRTRLCLPSDTFAPAGNLRRVLPRSICAESGRVDAPRMDSKNSRTCQDCVTTSAFLLPLVLGRDRCDLSMRSVAFGDMPASRRHSQAGSTHFALLRYVSPSALTDADVSPLFRRV